MKHTYCVSEHTWNSVGSPKSFVSLLNIVANSVQALGVQKNNNRNKFAISEGVSLDVSSMLGSNYYH